MKKISTWLMISLIATVCSVTSLSVMAQDAPGPLAEQWLFTPKADHLMEFTTAMKEHVELRKEQGDPRNWDVFSAHAGDNFGQYAVRYCCTNWDQLDAYNKWDADHPSVMEHWMKSVQPHIAETQHYYSHIDWANSHWNADGGPYRYITVDEWTVKGGSEAQLTAARKKMSQIALNQGWSAAGHNWVWFTHIGGVAKLAIAIPHKNFASMAGSGDSFGEFLAKHLGSQEAATGLMQEFASSTWQSETTIWEHRPELSMSGNE